MITHTSCLVRRRADLIREGLLIPVFTSWDDMNSNKISPYTMKQTELMEWTPTFGQDNDGRVYTPAGIFYSIDLDFKYVRHIKVEYRG